MKIKKVFIFSFFCLLSFSGCAKRVCFHIQETLDNGVIACKGPSCSSIIKISTISNNIFAPTVGRKEIKIFEPLMVFIEKNNNMVFYYDGQNFSIPVNDIKQEGTYKYKTAEGKNKTIPIIKFLKTNKIKDESLPCTRVIDNGTILPLSVDGVMYEEYKEMIQKKEEKDNEIKQEDKLLLITI